jgi:selenocysteine lyase/cysteine desulfurase
MNITPKLNPKNRYELDQMADEFSAFVENYPSFNQTRLLDEWRKTQYNRLDANGQIYLDYTGGGLYSELQLCEHMELLRTSVLGNPHSANPTSLAMTDLVEGTRKYVLRYFNAAQDPPVLG